MANPTKDDVREAFGHLNSAEFNESDLFEGIRVAVSDDDAGQLFATIRKNGYDAESKRLGDTLVSHIETTKGLGELFG